MIVINAPQIPRIYPKEGEDARKRLSTMCSNSERLHAPLTLLPHEWKTCTGDDLWLLLGTQNGTLDTSYTYLVSNVRYPSMNNAHLDFISEFLLPRGIAGHKQCTGTGIP